MPFFESTTLAPEDPILGIPKIFNADERDVKVNLGVGVYRTAEGKSLVLNSIRRAEVRIAERQLPKDYLPIEGDKEFLKELGELLFGSDCEALNDGRIPAIQTIGGSGALRMGGELVKQEIGSTIHVSSPTWDNHTPLFGRAGVSHVEYPYFSSSTRLLDFDGMCDAIRKIPSKSPILFHACCHNPTGVDPDQEQWKEISELVKKQELFPFFDCAYLGFGSGLSSDTFAIRHFLEQGHEMMVAMSCSKNFGLYGERSGALFVVTNDSEKGGRVLSQMKRHVRGNYSNPPHQSARLVKVVLQSFRAEWKQEVDNMRQRIQEMRQALVSALQNRCSTVDFTFIQKQKGMFSFTGLSPEQVLRLRKEKALYMTPNGRINVAGLNWNNMDYVAECLVDAYQGN